MKGLESWHTKFPPYLGKGLRQWCTNFLPGGPHAVRWTSAEAGCLKKMYSLFSNPAHGTLHKREKEGVELRPKTLYTHIQLHLYIMSMVATQLFLFLSCGACRGPYSKKSEYNFLRHPACRGPDLLHKLKSSRGPDLAHGPDFGHAWFKAWREFLCSSRFSVLDDISCTWRENLRYRCSGAQ